MSRPVDSVEPAAAVAEGPAQGPAFPLFVKVLAGAVMAGVVFSGLRVLGPLTSASLPWGAGLSLVALLAMLVACFVAMLRSRTSITSTHLRQTWLWNKEVALSEITQAKLIYVPYLAWLIAPRLVVRAGGKGLYTFYAAEPAVLRAFWRLAVGRVPGASAP